MFKCEFLFFKVYVCISKFNYKTMTDNIKILLADDHNVVRHGTSLLLKDAFENITIFHANSLHSILEMLPNNPDLILLDINLPGGNSTKMIEDIKSSNSEAAILMFSAFDETKYALRYIYAGANGFLKKDSTDDEIINAIKCILKTGKYISKSVQELILNNAFNKTPVNPLETLSNREIEVALLIAKGDGSIEIANKLNIKMTTVSTFKSRIYQKLQVNNIASLIEILRIYQN